MGLAHTKKLYQSVLNHEAVEIKENDLDTSKKLISREPLVKYSVSSKILKSLIKKYIKLSLEEHFKNKPISRFGLCTRFNKMVIAKQLMNSSSLKDPVSYLGNYKTSLSRKLTKNDTIIKIEDHPKKSKNSKKNSNNTEIKKFSLIKLPFKKIKKEEDYSKLKSISVREALKKNNLRLKSHPQKAIRCARRNFKRAIININALSKRLAAKPITPPKTDIEEAVYFECSDSISLETPVENSDQDNLNIKQIKSEENQVDEIEKDDDPNANKVEQIASKMSDKMNDKAPEKKEQQKIGPELKITYSNSNKSIASSCTTPSETARACVKYRKTAQQALSQLNDQVSSVLRNTLCSIDDIRKRVHCTVTEINENELHYEYLKAHPNACTVRNSEPNQNVNELDIEPQIAKTQSDNRVANHPRKVESSSSLEEFYRESSKTSVEIPANKCQGMSKLPKIVSLGELLNLSPSAAEQRVDSSPENKTKTDTIKSVKELREDNEILPDETTETCLLRIEAHRDLHTILVQELKTNSEICLKPRKNKTKQSKYTKKRSKTDLHMVAEELYVPEKQINKIPANTEVLAENTFSLTSPQFCPPNDIKKNSKIASLCTKSKSLLNSNNDNYDKTLSKYSDSLWFSQKTKKKIKMTKEVVVSRDGSETVIKVAASKSSVVIENTVVQTDDTIKPPKKCNILSVNYKNRLNCFDILDEITLTDLKPIEPEYPRKDHIGTNQSSSQVEKTYLYKLVYACPNKYFMQLINVQIPKNQCSFPNCLLCRSACQSLRNGNKYCQTEIENRNTIIARRNNLNMANTIKPNPVMSKTKIKPAVTSKKRRCLKSDSKKSKTKKETPNEMVPEIKTGKKCKEKNKTPTNSPTEKRQRRNTIADVEMITEKLKPFMLDPCIRYHKNITVAQTISPARTIYYNSTKTASCKVADKLRPYIFGFEDCHFKTYTVMPVFVTTYNKTESVKNCLKSKQASPEVKEKLRPYILNPNQNHFCANRAMVSNSHKLKLKPNNIGNNQSPCKHLIKTSSSNSETQCNRCHSQLSKNSSRVSTATSSSDVRKLQSYMYDNSLKYPNIVTAMPAAITRFENYNFDTLSTSSKTQKGNSGDYPMQRSNKFISKLSPKLHFTKAQFKSSASLEKNEKLPKARTNAASNLITFLAKQNLIQPQHSFGDNLSEYLHQTPTQVVGVALHQKTPRKSVSSKLEQAVHSTTTNLTKSQTVSKTSNETVKPTTPKMHTKVRRKSTISRIAPPLKPQKEIEKPDSTKNILESNIQNVIDMIETKIIDIISSPNKTHSDTFNNVEQEIIQILDTIRQVESKPLNTIEECLDSKGSQAEVNILHKKGENYHLLTPDDSSIMQTTSELSKKEPKFFPFEANKKLEHFKEASECLSNQSQFFTDVNGSVEKLERTIDYLEADQQQYQAPTKSETLQNLAKNDLQKSSKTKIQTLDKLKIFENVEVKNVVDEEVTKIDKVKVQKIIEKRVESINKIINKLNEQELDHDQDVENKLKSIKKISEISLAEKTEEDSILDDIPETTSSPANDSNEEPVEKLYVNDDTNEERCDKEVSTTTLDFEMTKNENDDETMIEKCKSSYYLTPFMKALIKYRNDDATKSSSILDFLDTLSTISNDTPVINKLSKLNFKQKITISEILQNKNIYYPAEIYHPISMYNAMEKPDEKKWLLSLFGNLRKRLERKPIESNKIEETPELRSIESSPCLVEPPENIVENLIEIQDVMYDDKQHGSFLNSLYSAIFAAVFFSFTLNYSCH